MGYALANACYHAGADVILVSGKHVSLKTPFGVRRLDVGTAEQMLKVCLSVCQKADIFIAAAAVADFKAASVADHKIKKTKDQQTMTLQLIKIQMCLPQFVILIPILSALALPQKLKMLTIVPKSKLAAKQLDMIAVNDVSDKTIGFGSENNAMTVFFCRTIRPNAPKSTQGT